MGRINAGALRHRADFILNGASVSDGQGGNVPGGEDTALSRSCRVQALKGTQALRLGQELNGAPYEVTARYDAQVLVANRITWKPTAQAPVKTLKVVSAVPDENREFLTLYALDSGQ